MAYTQLPGGSGSDGDYVVGDDWTQDEANLTRDNFDDHEDRIAALETEAGTLSSDAATPVRVATVTLTDAQIKALPTTAIEIIAAPAGNTRIKLHGVTYQFWFEHGAYTNVNATSALLYLQTSSGTILGGYLANDSGVSLGTLTTLLAAASVLTVDAGPYATNPAGTYLQPLLTGAPSSADGKAVQLSATNNGAGNFTGGNAANTLTVLAYYTVETLPNYRTPFTPFDQKSRRPRRTWKRRSGTFQTPATLL